MQNDDVHGGSPTPPHAPAVSQSCITPTAYWQLDPGAGFSGHIDEASQLGELR